MPGLFHTAKLEACRQTATEHAVLLCMVKRLSCSIAVPTTEHAVLLCMILSTHPVAFQFQFFAGSPELSSSHLHQGSICYMKILQDMPKTGVCAGLMRAAFAAAGKALALLCSACICHTFMLLLDSA